MKRPRLNLRTLLVVLLLVWTSLLVCFYCKLKGKNSPRDTLGITFPVSRPVISLPPPRKSPQEPRHEKEVVPLDPPRPQQSRRVSLPKIPKSPVHYVPSNNSDYAKRYSQDIQQFMVEYSQFKVKDVQNLRCDEAHGFFLSADGEECVTSCSMGEALAESKTGEMQCVAVRGPKTYDGAFTALHVYKGPVEDPDYEIHLHDLRRWLGNIAGYNKHFGTCYHAVIFHYGPGMWWRNVFSDHSDFRCPSTGEPMTYWVDISEDSPFAVPPSARALGVTETNIGAECHGHAWPPGYAYMIRFRVALMWDRKLPYWPVVAQYKVLFQLDGDCVVGNVREDPIRVMLDNGYLMGYYMCAIASSSCTRGSWGFVKNWAKANGVKWPKNGMKKDLVFMGGMVLYSPALFGESELAQSLLREIDASGNIYKHRWPEHLYYTVIPYLLDEHEKTCYLGEIFDIYHHNSLFKKQTCPNLSNAVKYKSLS